MKKILFISSSFVTSTNRDIYKFLKINNFNVLLISPKSLASVNFNKKADVKRDNENIVFLNTSSNNPRFQIYKGLSKIINKFSPDHIIYDSDPYTFQTLFLVLKKNTYKLHCITCENMDFTKSDLNFRNILKILFKQMFNQFLVKSIDTLYTVNNAGFLLYQKRGFNVSKMPIGFNPDKFYIDLDIRKKIREKLKLKNNVIGYFGRICNEKGLHLLINSLGKLYCYKWTFLIDEFKEYYDPYIDHIQSLIKKNKIENRIKYINPTHDNICNYINAVDIVVLPSISTDNWIEQYGRVISESLACGKNVIVSSSGHLPDLVGKHGKIFIENNESDLILALESFLRKDMSNKINYDAEKYALDNLSLDKQAKILAKSLRL